MMRRKKMLFNLGLTLIIGVAVYMYYALKDTDTCTKHNVGDVFPDNIEESNTLTNTMHTNYKNADTTDKVLNGNSVIEDSEMKKEKSSEKTNSSALDTDMKKTIIDNKNAKGEVNTSGNSQKQTERHLVKEPRSLHWRTGLHLSVVVCGDRLEETLVMLKSAVLFSRSLLVFHIFTDTDLQKALKDQLEFWPPRYREKVEYHIYNLSFPFTSDRQREEWKQLFKPCASQRLFIPSLLVDVDAILYLDTDVLFLSPMDEIWTLFSQFNATQMAAVSPEHEDAAIGWYNRFARHPYYGELGINSGVMLMNLTRMRESHWSTALLNYFKEYRLKITFGDQDLINIYFHFFPHELFEFGCEWNYRPDHCMYKSVCPPAEVSGAYLLHGCRRVWHEDKQPGYKAVYTAFKEHRLGSSIEYDLLESLTSHLNTAKPSNCGKLRHIFTRQIETYINNTKMKQGR